MNISFLFCMVVHKFRCIILTTNTSVCFVYSLSSVMTTGKEKEIIAMEQGGNKLVNNIFEAKMKDKSSKPPHNADLSVRNEFCKKKYIDRKYYNPSWYKEVFQGIAKRKADMEAAQAQRATSGIVNPLRQNALVVSEVSVKKEVVQDEFDFFRSFNSEA